MSSLTNSLIEYGHSFCMVSEIANRMCSNDFSVAKSEEIVYCHYGCNRSAGIAGKFPMFLNVSYLHLPVMIIFSTDFLLSWSCDMISNGSDMRACTFGRPSSQA